MAVLLVSGTRSFQRQLPGLINSEAPVALINRKTHLSLNCAIASLEGTEVDPLDPEAVAALAVRAAVWSRSGMHVFCSSWINSRISPSGLC